MEVEISKVTQEPERPTSTVKFASHLEVADIPSRSRSSVGPSRLSLMDEHGKPSRTSITTGTTGTEGMVFGRDAVVEREKINEEARNTFAVMDLRYRDMVQDLIDLDNAFELGLTSGSRQEFEAKIQGMKIVKTPPSGSGERAKVELEIKDIPSTADDVSEQRPDHTTDKPDVSFVENADDLSEGTMDIKSDNTVTDKEIYSRKSEIADDGNEQEHSRDVETLRKGKSDVEIVVTDASGKCAHEV